MQNSFKFHSVPISTPLHDLPSVFRTSFKFHSVPISTLLSFSVQPPLETFKFHSVPISTSFQTLYKLLDLTLNSTLFLYQQGQGWLWVLPLPPLNSTLFLYQLTRTRLSPSTQNSLNSTLFLYQHQWPVDILRKPVNFKFHSVPISTRRHIRSQLCKLYFKFHSVPISTVLHLYQVA